MDNIKIETKRIKYEDDFISKLKEGKIMNSKGQTDTYSFMIPITKIVEPLLVQIYALPEYENSGDYYNYDLFLKNIYFDKAKLFKYIGYDDRTQKENYMLYTDEALNIILQKIEVINNKYIHINDPLLYDICINC